MIKSAMADGMVLAPGSVFAAEYRIKRALDESGAGAVYVAEQIATGSERALKVMDKSLVADPRLRQRFEEEARAGSRIQSEHVAQTVGAGVEPVTGLAGIAMELLEGEDLGAMLATRGALPLDELVSLFEQLCHALAAAHDVSIVHCDLKPGNVFLAKSRRVGASFQVKVLDFGIGKLVAESRASAAAPVEPPLYVPPELIGRKLGAVPPSDVWSLGLLAFRALTGRPYWKAAAGGAIEDVTREVLEEPIVPASQRAAELGAGDRIPPGFDEWFARCVVRESGKRFSDAREAFFDLGRRTGARPATQPFAPPASVPAVSTQPAMPPFGAAGWSGPPGPGATAPMGGAPPMYGPPPYGAPPYGQPPGAPPGPDAPWGPAPPRPSGGNGAVIAAVGGFVAFVLLIFVAAGIFAFRRSSSTSAPPPIAAIDDEEGIGAGGLWSDEDCPVPVSSRDPVWGSRTAPVTIVEFSDFQCPFCQRAEGTLDQLRSRYGQSELRIVWKNNPLPFHKDAKPTAAAAMAVFEVGGSPAFWSFHQKAFANSRDLAASNHEVWAIGSGVDASRWRTALASGRPDAKVDADLVVGKSAGVTGTPAFFINGIFLSGAQPIEKFTAVIDEEARAAKADRAAGTPADRLYVKRTLANKKAEPSAKTPDKEPEDDRTVWNVPVGASPTRGPDTALVTIVEFSDFQCPFCKRVEPTLDDVRAAYGDQVRIVWKNNPLPFHNRAEPAAELALEAFKQKGGAGFWSAHDLLFKNQQALDDEDLGGYARTLGLDTARVRTAITTKAHAASISADQDLADDLGASGTPNFFINGRHLTGAQPLERFKAIIDEELPKAKALLARGVAPKDLYATIVKDGKGAPPIPRVTVEPAPATAPWRGGAGATVVIHEFSDFQCPFCKRVEPTMDQVLAQYGDRVKIVWRHKPLPMHKDAQLAAEASQEVLRQQGNAGFWRFHDRLFDNQAEGLEREDLERYAQAQGVDMTKFRKALDEHTHRAAVEAESAASDRSGITGTPGFVINGYQVSGAQPLAKFKKVIDKALAEAGR